MSAPPKTKRESTRLKWKPIYLVHIYRYAREGLNNREIQELLHVSERVFIQWKKDMPEIVATLKLARGNSEQEGTFADYCYGRLSGPLRQLWDKILYWEEYDHLTTLQKCPTSPEYVEQVKRKPRMSGAVQIELMLADNGQLVRQQLYIHALISSSFSPSRAMSRVGVNKQMLDKWIADDVGFAELVEEISWHKGNFFEEALVKLVEEGETSAVLFANKTWNKSRGYSGSVDININGKMEHSGSILHGVLDLSELLPYMSQETRTGVMEALRQRDELVKVKKTQHLMIPPPVPIEQIVDAEIVKVAQTVDSTEG